MLVDRWGAWVNVAEGTVEVVFDDGKVSLGTVEQSRSSWGVAPWGPMHLGLDNLMHAQRQLIDGEYDHTVVLADLHMVMTTGMTTSDVERRCAYYEAIMRGFYGIDARYMRGSSFQSSAEYTLLLYRMLGRISLGRVKDTLRSAGESKGHRAESVGALVAPVMQALDGPFLNIHLVLADQSQAKTYKLYKEKSGMIEVLDKCSSSTPGRSYQLPAAIRYVDLAVDINGKALKHSSSADRITLHETPDSLRAKVRRLFAPPVGQPLPSDRSNALVAYFEYSVFPWIDESVDVRDGTTTFRFQKFDEFLGAYESGEMHPSALKPVLFEILNERIGVARRAMSLDVRSWVDEKRARGER